MQERIKIKKEKNLIKIIICDFFGINKYVFKKNYKKLYI